MAMETALQKVKWRKMPGTIKTLKEISLDYSVDIEWRNRTTLLTAEKQEKNS
jgi:nuclear transport factor 2 (NTF2) superfamily protein